MAPTKFASFSDDDCDDNGNPQHQWPLFKSWSHHREALKKEKMRENKREKEITRDEKRERGKNLEKER